MNIRCYNTILAKKLTIISCQHYTNNKLNFIKQYFTFYFNIFFQIAAVGDVAKIGKSQAKDSIERLYVDTLQAIQMLQVEPEEFKQLCILKNVLPLQVNTTKYKNVPLYRRKDINAIQRSQAFIVLRQLHSYEKKHQKYVYLKDDYKLKFLELQRPYIDYIQLINEKYPNIVDALYDLDDALSTLYIYSLFTDDVQLKGKIDKQLQIFMKFVSEKQLLTKIFITNKGYYTQAIIQQVLVTWVIPHQYNSEVPQGIELFMLKTFSQFYVKLLEGVNYFLHNNEIDQLQNHQQAVFQGQIYYSMPEVPQIIKYVIQSGGGKITSDAAESSHIIADRIKMPGKFSQMTDVTVIQPQFVVDSFNLGCIINPSEYAVGVKLPAHISPFEFDFTGQVQPAADKYVPDRYNQLVAIYKQQYGSDVQQQVQVDQQEIVDDETKPLGQIVQFDDADKEIADLMEKIKTSFEYNQLAKKDIELQQINKELRENISQLSKSKRTVYEQLKIKEDLEKEEKERLLNKKQQLEKQQQKQNDGGQI